MDFRQGRLPERFQSAHDSTTQLTSDGGSHEPLSRPGTETQFGAYPKVAPGGDGEQYAGDVADRAKLRAMGYDPSLGRRLGFWGATAMNYCHMSVMFEYVSSSILYAWNGPKLFLIGYPFVAVLHLILLGPFSELASAYPVSGALATWAWRAAKAGVRYERQWGYLVSGFVVAAHVGKIISYMYNVTLAINQLYLQMAGVPGFNVLTGAITGPQPIPPGVFQVMLVAVCALCILTRIGRSNTFWILAGLFNLALSLAVFAFICAAATKLKTGTQIKLGFNNRRDWTHGWAYMIFQGLPTKVVGLDCPAYMAEEIKNPAKNVPRAMFATTLVYFIQVYMMVTCYIFWVVPTIGSAGSLNPMLTVSTVLGWVTNYPLMYALAILIIVACVAQVLAQIVVTTRLIFALGRDCAIPFGNLLSRTDKKKEPWVADLVLIASLFLSTTGWLWSINAWNNMVQVFNYWFMALVYIMPLGLYLCSNLELQYEERTEFSLRKWSKPMTALSISWLALSCVQGCFPINIWHNVMPGYMKNDDTNYFPFVVIALFIVMVISWFLYGNHHYVGPIRALTIWSAGIEINPNDYTSAKRRKAAIDSYTKNQTGGSRSSGTGTAGVLSRLKTFPSKLNLLSGNGFQSLSYLVPPPTPTTGSIPLTEAAAREDMRIPPTSPNGPVNGPVKALLNPISPWFSKNSSSTDSGRGRSGSGGIPLTNITGRGDVLGLSKRRVLPASTRTGIGTFGAGEVSIMHESGVRPTSPRGVGEVSLLPESGTFPDQLPRATMDNHNENLPSPIGVGVLPYSYSTTSAVSQTETFGGGGDFNPSPVCHPGHHFQSGRQWHRPRAGGTST